jgi:hypothetical protein
VVKNDWQVASKGEIKKKVQRDTKDPISAR